MLSLQIASSMPHAITPSGQTSWSGTAADSEFDTLPRLPLPRKSKPITPPQDMIEPTAYISTASGLSSLPHISGLRSMYAGSTEPSFYSTQSMSSNVRSYTPDSQHTLLSYADSDTQSNTTVKNGSLSTPTTINAPQTDLSALAAEVSGLLWFETTSVFDMIDKGLSDKLTTLSPHIVPSEPFRRWLTGLLQTTQVAPNVIILALLFIYRLKCINSKVSAVRGSEFRLMTVALMLGNKYLDDNTYTNKTWAEVSGISVQEVHTMEVEFLSNMRFSLFTTETEWSKWHQKLGKFGAAAHKVVLEQEAALAGAVNPLFLAPLPSPSKPHSPLSPYSLTPLGYVGMNVSHASTTPLLLPQVSSTVISPIGALPELGYSGLGKKRRYDDVDDEPPTKRIHTSMPMLSGSSNFNLLPPPTTAANTLRANLPSLTIPSLNTMPPLQQLNPALPPPGSRAMSLIYPSVPSRPQSAQIIPPIQTTMMSSTSIPAVDPRQLSPYHISQNSSPVAGSANPLHLSPSSFYINRSSPYRPVRQVKTLLVPPRAATSMYNAPRQVGQNHLQYHSLGQPLSERHYGHVPYMHRDAWPQANQLPPWPAVTSYDPFIKQ